MLAVLVLAQFFHTLFPGRVRYIRRLILSLTGMALGELVGTFLPGPRLGELHAAWDIAVTTALQLTANRFFP